MNVGAETVLPLVTDGRNNTSAVIVRVLKNLWFEGKIIIISSENKIY